MLGLQQMRLLYSISSMGPQFERTSWAISKAAAGSRAAAQTEAASVHDLGSAAACGTSLRNCRVCCAALRLAPLRACCRATRRKCACFSLSRTSIGKLADQICGLVIWVRLDPRQVMDTNNATRRITLSNKCKCTLHSAQWTRPTGCLNGRVIDYNHTRK